MGKDLGKCSSDFDDETRYYWISVPDKVRLKEIRIENKTVQELLADCRNKAPELLETEEGRREQLLKQFENQLYAVERDKKGLEEIFNKLKGIIDNY